MIREKRKPKNILDFLVSLALARGELNEMNLTGVAFSTSNEDLTFLWPLLLTKLLFSA